MGFQALEIAMKAAAGLKPVLVTIKAEDRDLWDQGYRALKSVVLNVAEGGKRGGKDRGYHFRIAAGSAAELRAALQLAVTFDFVSAERVAPIDALLDRELAMLYRLEHPKP